MIIDCISDLHGFYPELKGGDLLIVAGDLTANDRPEQYCRFFDWLQSLSYNQIVLIGGNHDNLLQNVLNCPISQQLGGFPNNAHYLCDSGTEFEGLKIWGCPWSRTFEGMNPHCKAFTVDTEQEMDKLLYRIPNEVDILITHEAPYSILDQIDFSEGDSSAYSVGSHALLYHSRMRQPKLHIFGHIHEGYGEFEDCGTKYINASHVNERYQPINKPIRIIL